MNYIHAFFLLCMVTSSGATYAGDGRLPNEVRRFIEDRESCDHFRSEPFEGTSKEMVERREFLIQSVQIYCSGTDRRLAALKARYKNNKSVMSKLNKYEEKIGE